MSRCAGEPLEQQAVIIIQSDQTSPHIRESLTTRHNFYPFSWVMFRFSEPLGFTTDSYPFGSFTTQEQGEALLAMRGGDLALPSPGGFNQWPWGPVVGMAISDPSYRRGGSVWFELVGAEWDAAGNSLVSDFSIYEVIDLGPLAARHDFDEEPPLLGFSAAEYVHPGAGNLCESGGGCVVLTQYPGNCDLEGNLVGSAPMQFAFRVGGPDVPGGLAAGVRVRYRHLAMDDYPEYARTLFALSGVAEHSQTLAPATLLAQPINGFTHASDFSETTFQDLLDPSDDFGLAISWECPLGLQPHRAIVIESVEATLP
jgi:hypothetical protein